MHWDLQRRSGPSGLLAWTCCFGPELSLPLTGGVDPLTGGVEVLEMSDMSESVSSSTLAGLFAETCFGPEPNLCLTGGVDPLTEGVEVLEMSDTGVEVLEPSDNSESVSSPPSSSLAVHALVHLQ